MAILLCNLVRWRCAPDVPWRTSAVLSSQTVLQALRCENTEQPSMWNESGKLKQRASVYDSDRTVC
eukprot:6565753-Prymnesium_polylepis.1